MKKIMVVTALALSALCLSTPVLTTGCKAPQIVVAYKTLASVEVTVDAARKAFASEVKAGRIALEVQKQALVANEKFHSAFLTALTVAQTAQAPSPENVSAAAAEFTSFVYSIIKK